MAPPNPRIAWYCREVSTCSTTGLWFPTAEIAHVIVACSSYRTK
jgi:hypothetical protein